MTRTTFRRWTATLAVLAWVAAARPAAGQGVHVALVPGALAVDPDSSFSLDLQVTQAGSAFNGFDAVVTYDTTAVTFVRLNPVSLQQGSSLTGACGATFHRFSAVADSLAITEVLMCANQSLTGPGQLYRLRFKAGHTPRDTWVRIRHMQFYDAGVFVDTLATVDAHIGIGVPVAAPLGSAPVAALHLRASPNPARGGVALSLEGRAVGASTLAVHDAQGRVVRRLAVGAGLPRAVWDGRDDAGRPLPPGLYLVTWTSGAARASARVTLLH